MFPARYQQYPRNFPFISACLNDFIAHRLHTFEKAYIKINGTRLHSNEFPFFCSNRKTSNVEDKLCGSNKFH
jgi:hypothetical protein